MATDQTSNNSGNNSDSAKSESITERIDQITAEAASKSAATERSAGSASGSASDKKESLLPEMQLDEWSFEKSTAQDQTPLLADNPVAQENSLNRDSADEQAGANIEVSEELTEPTPSVAENFERPHAAAMNATTAATAMKMPNGIPYIIGNEAAERFSFYGMRTILVIFMTKYLMDSSGTLAPMAQAEAMQWYHSFVGFTYFFPLIGALFADIFWGKYKTIMSLSVVYCLGHLSLAFMDIPFFMQIMEPKAWLAMGLGLIAVGSGGIKPCVSAHVGDQFKKENAGLLDKVFGWFYFSINFGGVLSVLLTPILLNKYGPSVAFGIPGALMLIATWVFWLGRKKFVAIPSVAQEIEMKENRFEGEKVFKTVFNCLLVGGAAFLFWQKTEIVGAIAANPYLKIALYFLLFSLAAYLIKYSFRGADTTQMKAVKTYSKEVFSGKGIKAILGLGMLYLFIAVFWALFDQTGSSWVLQADKMDRWIDLRFGFFEASWLRFELLPSQIQAANPVLILLYIPVFNYLVYPFAAKYVKVTPLRKIGAGFFITAVSFSIIALIEQRIVAGATPSIIWQFIAYAIITAGEVVLSITALEYSYTQAPNKMKSVIMGLFLMSVSLGNFITAGVNNFIQNPDGSVALAGPNYFWFFAGLVTAAGCLYIVAAILYKEESYIQDFAGAKTTA